jgi:hypothetical protein
MFTLLSPLTWQLLLLNTDNVPYLFDRAPVTSKRPSLLAVSLHGIILGRHWLTRTRGRGLGRELGVHVLAACPWAVSTGSTLEPFVWNSRRSRRTGRARWNSQHGSHCTCSYESSIFHIAPPSKHHNQLPRPTSTAPLSVANHTIPAYYTPRQALRKRAQQHRHLSKRTIARKDSWSGFAFVCPRGLVLFSIHCTRMSGISPTSHARNGSPAPSRSLTPRQTVSPLLLPSAGADAEDVLRRPSIQFKAHANATRPRGSPRRGQPKRRISSPPPPP